MLDGAIHLLSRIVDSHFDLFATRRELPGRFLGRPASTYTSHLLRAVGADPLTGPTTSNQELTTMNLKRSHRQSARRLELLDTMMNSYINWRDHSRAVHESYRRWTDSTGGDRGAAYDQYLTALDREERAAHGYKHTLEHTQAT
jgi:hypothetical protein